MTTPISFGAFDVSPLWIAAAALLALLAIAALVRSRRNKRSTVRDMRRADSRQLKKEHPEGVVRATAYALWVDALKACTARFARLKALEEAIAHDEGQIERIARRQKHLDQQSDDRIASLRLKHEEAMLACSDQKPPEMKYRHASAWSWLLLAGDFYVVKTLIQIGDSNVVGLAAYSAAAAISLALWLLGRKVGIELRRFRCAPLFTAAVLGLLLAFAGGLFMLRIELEIAWLILAVCPAIGTAITKMLGPTAEQRKASGIEGDISEVEAEAKEREARANREQEILHQAIKKSATEHSEKRESVQCRLQEAAGKVKALLVAHDLDTRQEDFVQIVAEVGLGEHLATHQIERMLVDLTVPRHQKYLDLTPTAPNADRTPTSAITTQRSPSANGSSHPHEVSA